jgi:hypothetical protein
VARRLGVNVREALSAPEALEELRAVVPGGIPLLSALAELRVRGLVEYTFAGEDSDGRARS